MQLKRTSILPGQLALPFFEFTSSAPSSLSSPLSPNRPAPSKKSETSGEQSAPFNLMAPAPLTEPFRPPKPANDQRVAVLLGERVPYTFRRSSRKTIGFSVGDEGLLITAPRWVRLADVDAAMEEKARWILTKLNEQRERRAELVQRKVDWRNGAEFPFLGSDITISLDSSTSDTLFDAHTRQLRIALPLHAQPQQIKDRVQAWLQRQAKRVFDERVAHFAERLRVHVRDVKLSNANTRWGTASADGDIRLNWRLIHFALPVIDYVAAHEVAHLREMNHSPAFWATVKSIFPEFEAAKALLKDEKLPRFDDQ